MLLAAKYVNAFHESMALYMQHTHPILETSKHFLLFLYAPEGLCNLKNKMHILFRMLLFRLLEFKTTTNLWEEPHKFYIFYFKFIFHRGHNYIMVKAYTICDEHCTAFLFVRKMQQMVHRCYACS